MIFSRIKSRLLALHLILMTGVYAEANPLDLLRRHRYEEAIAGWEKDAGSSKVDEKSLRALKGQALSYYKLGSLYTEFNRFSNALMEDYYKNLSQSNSSPLVNVYLGQIQYHNGNWKDAKQSFEKVEKSTGMSAGSHELIQVYLHSLTKKLGGAAAATALNPKDNTAQWQYLELMQAVEAPKNLDAFSQRAKRIQLQLLLQKDQPDEMKMKKGLKALVWGAHKAEMFLDEGKNTQINFYDPGMLGTLSDGYFAMARLINLKIKKAETKFPQMAAKFGTNIALAESSLKLNRLKEVKTYINGDMGVEAQLIRAQVLAIERHGKEAKELLTRLERENKSPDVKKWLADCYFKYDLDREKALELAAQATRDKPSTAYFRTYASILFSQGKFDAALQQYDRGYKIEYRNRIDQIDPEYICERAFAIFKANKLRYEEVVETLYHLQKEFLPCRPMHYAMQGLSAGLARDYESQNIFRKGG